MPGSAPAPLRTLETLAIDNRFAALGEAYFSRVAPTPLTAPQLLHVNAEAAALIDLHPAEAARPEFVATFAGNRPLPGGDPLAMLYAGHQFGVFVPQLGDGRALLLAQVRNGRGQSWDLQLKGSGPTPYSRFADGRAVLRSSVREYLCGEAMHHLGIPTTRALCLVTSPDPVQRETVESAAVICRMAPSHVRFGSFEVFYYRGQHARLAPLADHVIAGHFPELAALPAPERYARWLREVAIRTARLMAQWQAAGFCHGVMNTDNFSILGLTLDYGPYGFMEAFDPGWICNHSDEGGRYAWDRQPAIGHWNVSRLLQATLPLLHADPDQAVAIGQDILAAYPPAYEAAMVRRWLDKLGLPEEQDGDRALVNRWLGVLAQGGADFTRSFRQLSRVRAADEGPATGVREEHPALEAFDAWTLDYRARLRGLGEADSARAARMDAVNPKYVLRNHLAQAAIARAEAGDAGGIDHLLQLLRRPFDEQPEFEADARPAPAGTPPVCVSCSS